MQLLGFTLEHGILEFELRLAARHQTLGLLKIMETPHGLFVLAQLN